jgi:hypothetical protein
MYLCVFSLPFWILDCSVEESKSKSSTRTHTLASVRVSASPSSDEAESDGNIGLTIITSSSLMVSESRVLLLFSSSDSSSSVQLLSCRHRKQHFVSRRDCFRRPFHKKLTASHTSSSVIMVTKQMHIHSSRDVAEQVE